MVKERKGGHTPLITDEEQIIADDSIQVTVNEEDAEFLDDELSEHDDVEEVTTPTQEVTTPIRQSTTNSPARMSEVAFNFKNPDEALKYIPGLDQMVYQLVENRVNQALKSKGLTGEIDGINCVTPQRNSEINPKVVERTPKNTVKSPSDTTIYALALKLIPGKDKETELIDKISNFVESVIIEQLASPRPTECTAKNTPERRVERPQPQPGCSSTVTVPGYKKANQRADNYPLEAEKFKVTVATPGITCTDDNPVQFYGKTPLDNPMLNGCGMSDDEFFHLTCHIDKGMCEKIERGEYIELEKLLLKERGGIPNPGGVDSSSRLEWIYKEGHTYLVPVSDKANRISNFHKWEQAFCNPTRSKEIWQYISVINTASASYVWDNVYNYDGIFRHLMAFNPQRNLSMRDPSHQEEEGEVSDTVIQMQEWYQASLGQMVRVAVGEKRRNPTKTIIVGISIKASNANLGIDVALSNVVATVTCPATLLLIVLK